ncbi:hypothetical protein MMC11_001224 [Xylographa trunciseda]|nr:hypothetical protein [Xylographa trunciseda]
MSILSSISLFSLSHVPGRESLAVDAQYHYSLAVSRLNKAIADPVASKKNDTLLCVLLFQLREIITMTDSSLVIWRQHIEGALAVCRMRGKPRNILERRLYAAIRDLLVMRRLRDHKLIPQDEIDTLWTRWPFDESSYHYDRLAERSLDIPNLRAKAYKLLRQPMNPSVALALQTISADAKRLDLRIIIWPDELPPSGFYSKLFTYKGPLPAHTQLSQIEIWPGAIDYYWDLDKAHMWNTYRMHRALILMVVINCAERLHSPAELRHNADYSNAVQVIRTMVDEVCASVPYILHSSRITRENASRVLLSAAHLRPTDVNFADSESRNLWDPTPSPSKSGRFSDAHVPVPLCNDRESRDCGDGKGHAWITLGGLPLISSLYIASTLICVPKKQRIWIRGRLRAIAESYSLDQAKVLENIVAQEEKQNMLDQGPSMGRMPTISDLAPLPWVEWGTEGEFEAKRGPTPIGIRQYLVPIQTNQIPSWGF